MMAALRLVQDNVRYVFLGMNEGGLIPATAEQTWARKFGDCKGKTVTLIALLQGLGIKAEPVLVNTTFGDALPERLPMVRLFDHVIVRATIEGQDYWLDGTRVGDRRIGDLTSSPFGWGLPVRTAGATLEELPLLPPSLPLYETNIVYDASQGFHHDVPLSGTLVFRGDVATMLGMAITQMDEKETREALQRFSAGIPDDEDMQLVDMKHDDTEGTVTIAFKGETRMDWSEPSNSNALRFRFDDNVIEWKAEFERDEGPFSDVPFALTFPTYLASMETVILPEGVTGFVIEGEDLDQMVAGTQISRKLSIEDGRATAYSTFRRVKKEISAANAEEALRTLKSVNSDEAFVRTPPNYEMSPSEVAAIVDGTPESSSDYNERGYLLLQQAEYEKAIEDIDQAIRLSPEWSTPASNRAISLIHLGKIDEAEAALVKAAALDDENFVVHQGYGMLHSARGKPGDAVESFTRSLELDPRNDFTLGARASAYERLGHLEKALADIDRILDFDPDNLDALWRAARLNTALGDEAGMLKAMDAMSRIAPEAGHPHATRAEFLGRFGRHEESAQSYERALELLDKQLEAAPEDKALLRLRRDTLAASGRNALAIKEITEALAAQPDNATLLNERCWIRATANIELEQALADCNLALRHKPDSAATIDSRGLVNLRLGRLDAAIADFDKALSLQSNLAASLYSRGIARFRKGDQAEAAKDIEAAKRLVFDIETLYKSYGIEPASLTASR
jgi:tetratricopeptide (TPR) repeat protein